MNGDIFALAIVVVGGVTILGFAAKIINNTPANLYADFLRQRAIAGAAASDVAREFRLRTAAAALRRKATREVLARPAAYSEVIASLAKAEGLKLAAIDKATARQFLQWAEGAELSEILYPAAMKAVWRARKPAAPAVDEDTLAALRVRG